MFFTILPPVVTAKFRSNKSFNFKYGKVEIRAKLPKGDWMFPGKYGSYELTVFVQTFTIYIKSLRPRSSSRISEIYLEPNETAYGIGPYANGLLRIAFIRGNEYLTNNNVPIGGNILSGGVIAGEVLRDTFQRVSAPLISLITHAAS